MRKFVELGLALIDYLKLELENSRRSVLSLCFAIGVLWASVLLIVCGIGMLLYSAFTMFTSFGLHVSSAAFFTAALCLFAAALLVWIGLRKL